MRFVKNFEKIALGGHNNQGLEFKNMDTEPQSNVGPGGMAPTGIASYQPLDSAMEKTKRGKKASDVQAAQFMFGKIAEAMQDSILTGKSSDIANTVANQLKWTSDNGSDYTDKIGDTREQRARDKKFARFRRLK